MNSILSCLLYLSAFLGNFIQLEGYSYRADHNRLMCARFSPDGKKIVTASYDGTAKVRDVETGKLWINIQESEVGN